MSSKLDELRKNLLGAQGFPPIASHPAMASRSNGKIDERTSPAAAPEMSPPLPDPTLNGQLNSAVGKVFEPAMVCRERWAELAKSLESLEDTTKWAAKALEPMKLLHEQMRKLSDTFEPMRAFEHELATMALSFTPIKDLHGEVAQVIQSFHGQLTDLAKSFEPAKLCKRRMAELASTLDAATQLQAEFY